MQNLGDITAIDGAKIPPVDVITGGSPCQDLSIAGKRAGLAGARSGLFMEQIRIIKEMRNHDRTAGRSGEFLRPRYMVWENVPGAFSSNKGKDFAAVLEETIRIVEPEAPSIEVPEKGWPAWGCYRSMDGRWSVAWRTLDAQYWGVPQRRRRIALVADFGGRTATEILFERKGMSWDTTESGDAREETAERTRDCAESTSISVIGFNYQAGSAANSIGAEYNKSPTILAMSGKPPAILRINDNAEGDQREAAVLPFDTTQITSPQNRSNPRYGDVCHTISSGAHPTAISITYQKKSGTLSPGAHAGGYSGQDAYNNMLIAHPILSKSNCSFRADMDTFPISDGFVRRLTPLECERLQGYPDGWTDIDDWTDSKGKVRKTSDSARYKALGNSIALPPWRFVLSRIYGYLRTGATSGSLFDGIGGFPLIWTQLGGKVVWASEIEEFCIAVTKRRFGHG